MTHARTIPSPRLTPCPIPPRGGIGLKREHHAAVLATRPRVGWFEIQAENYMGAGGPPLRALEAIRRDYPLSIHGVGLNLGGTDPLDDDHIRRLQHLVDRFEPGLVSEHLAWTAHDGAYLFDLLPLPYDDGTLRHVADRVARVQDRLRRPLLIENPASYLPLDGAGGGAIALGETEFLAELVAATGCGLLLDVNNVVVAAANLGFDPLAYLDRFPARHVGEIHLAGHGRTTIGGQAFLIDDHGSAVPTPVWTLFAAALDRIGRVPTLIEWDNDVPDLAVLAAEATTADECLARVDGNARAA